MHYRRGNGQPHRYTHVYTRCEQGRRDRDTSTHTHSHGHAHTHTHSHTSTHTHSHGPLIAFIVLKDHVPNIFETLKASHLRLDLDLHGVFTTFAL